MGPWVRVSIRMKRWEYWYAEAMRRLPRFICALSTGAILSVLVSWACALHSQEPLTLIWEAASPHFTSFLPPDWLSPPPNDSNGYRIQCDIAGVWTGFGATVEIGGADGRWEEHPDRSVFLCGLSLQQCGWPWHALECARAEANPGVSPGGKSCLVGGIEPPKFLQPTALPKTTRISSFRPALPLRPLWTGLLLDTFFYAAIMAGLIYAPRMVRQVWRKRHGLCTTCGYARTGLAPNTACPECGAIMSSPSQHCSPASSPAHPSTPQS
jgi:hypothetical protein